MKASLDSEDRYQWFSMPLQVRGVPSRATHVLLSCALDWRDLLDQTGAPGVVDERSIRLFRENADGVETETPVQYSPAPQPRFPERHLQSETPPHVSWVGDWMAAEAPVSLRGKGELTWIASGEPSGVCRYRLVWGVPLRGKVVQVPFPPNNLRCFDAEGRPTAVREFPRVQIRPQWPLGGKVGIHQDQMQWTCYHTGPTFDRWRRRDGTLLPQSARRPYFYPILGPDGVSLTELGKPHDPTGSHAHHYSLWVAHADVDGDDFWSEAGGCICHDRFERMEDGPLFGRLEQHALWATADKRPLREKRVLTMHATPEGFRLLDIDLYLTPAGDERVLLGQTPFGFLGARVAQSMTVFDGGGEIINAAGDQDEDGAFAQPSPWIDQSGPLSPSRWNGVTLFDSPANPRFPTKWHCRNDGWAGSSFTRDEPWEFEPGGSLKLRHRVLLHQGDSVEGEVDLRYQEYACQPMIEMGAASTMEGITG